METPTVIQTDTRVKKKFPAGTLPTANPSVIVRVITDGITDGFSVGNYGMACDFVATLCVIPTDIIRRKFDGYYPSVMPSVKMAWMVIVRQLSVKYRRILSVGISVGRYLKYIKKIIY